VIKVNEENTFKQQQMVVRKCKAKSSVILVKADNVIQHLLLQHMQQFVISEWDEVHPLESSSEVHPRNRLVLQQLLAAVETSKLVVTTHFMTSPSRYD